MLWGSMLWWGTKGKKKTLSDSKRKGLSELVCCNSATIPLFLDQLNSMYIDTLEWHRSDE